MSVMTLNTEFDTHDAAASMQVPGVIGLQNFSMGVHMNMPAKMVATVMVVTRAMSAQFQNWKRGVLNTRWYCIKMASLVSPMEVQYDMMLRYIH